MRLPLHVHYRGLPASEAVSAYIEAQIEHLTHLLPRSQITSCHVTLELLNHRAGKLGLYRATVELTVPRQRLVVGGRSHLTTYSDAYAALAASFQATRRRLAAYVERLRDDVKHHESPQATGEVARVFPDSGYGFLTTPDGREVYFDANSVLGRGFDGLTPGARVRFTEEPGDEGPQASSLTPLPAGKRDGKLVALHGAGALSMHS